MAFVGFFFFSSRRRHTRFKCDWSSDVCSSDLIALKSGEFQSDLAPIVSAFGGPVALVAGHNLRPEHLAPASSILVPVTGNEVSRRAAELAIALARACNCSLTALYAANPAGRGPRRLSGNPAARAEARAILGEVAEMADRQDLKIKTAVHIEVAPHQAILAQ